MSQMSQMSQMGQMSQKNLYILVQQGDLMDQAVGVVVVPGGWRSCVSDPERTADPTVMSPSWMYGNSVIWCLTL
jgi:hypothetical protein